MPKYYEDTLIGGFTLRHYFKTDEYAWIDYLWSGRRFKTMKDAVEWRAADFKTEQRIQRRRIIDRYGNAFLSINDCEVFTCPDCKCLVAEDQLVEHHEAVHGDA